MASRVIRKVRDMLDVDDSAIGDGKTPVYRTASGKHEYEAAGGAADLSSAVILAPAASARNVIQPTAGSVIAEIVRAHAAQTVDIFNVQKSDGASHLRVGATGAVGIGAGTYDPALYGGYQTAFVLSRADDGYWDAGGGPGFTPGATQSTDAFFFDVLVTPTADGGANFTEHYGMGSSLRYRGDKTTANLVGMNLESQHHGTKASGSGAQIVNLWGQLIQSYTDALSTGDITNAYGSYGGLYHRGTGLIDLMVAGYFHTYLYANSGIPSVMRGVVGRAEVAATGGTVPEMAAIRAEIASLGRAVTLSKGVDISNAGAAGIITSYGLFMAAQSGSTNVYGLYVAGGKSVFVDSLITGKIALPADADFANGQGGWWWDQANSLPKWKGKTSGGVVVNFVPADATALADHIADTADAHDASAISFSPTGTIAATDVQAAIAEVASEAAGGGISATIFDANTVLKADTDDTPVALAMAASTILARLASGSIKAAIPAEIAAMLKSQMVSALAPTGALAETVPRNGPAWYGPSGSLVSQRLTMCAIGLLAGQTITSISFMSSGTALSGGNHQYFGLFDNSAGSSSGTAYALLRGSADDTSAAWGAVVVKTLNLTTPYVTTRDGVYYLGILVDASTVPTLQASNPATALLAVPPTITAIANTGITVLPNPATGFGALANLVIYGYVS